MAKRRRKDEERAIARERIRILFAEAEQAALEGRLDRADRYVELARRIGMRYQVPIPRELKPFVCRRCGAYLLPGETSRVRTRGTAVATTCLRCGHVRRVPFRRERKERRRPREREREREGAPGKARDDEPADPNDADDPADDPDDPAADPPDQEVAPRPS